MASDMYLNIDGIDGESKDDGFGDSIDVMAWSWGMSQSGTMHGGGGGGAGKVAIQDISFTKAVDKSSTNLMLACCKGTHIEEATLTVRKAGGDPLVYLVITMKGVLVSSVSSGGSEQGEGLTENLTLNFREVEVNYQPQDDAGAADGGTIDMTWNIQANTE
jgi:type VI secretion system secreted protein Hcp